MVHWKSFAEVESLGQRRKHFYPGNHDLGHSGAFPHSLSSQTFPTLRLSSVPSEGCVNRSKGSELGRIVCQEGVVSN